MWFISQCVKPTSVKFNSEYPKNSYLYFSYNIQVWLHLFFLLKSNWLKISQCFILHLCCFMYHFLHFNIPLNLHNLLHFNSKFLQLLTLPDIKISYFFLYIVLSSLKSLSSMLSNMLSYMIHHPIFLFPVFFLQCRRSVSIVYKMLIFPVLCISDIAIFSYLLFCSLLTSESNVSLIITLFIYIHI